MNQLVLYSHVITWFYHHVFLLSHNSIVTQNYSHVVIVTYAYSHATWTNSHTVTWWRNHHGFSTWRLSGSCSTSSVGRSVASTVQVPLYIMMSMYLYTLQGLQAVLQGAEEGALPLHLQRLDTSSIILWFLCAESASCSAGNWARNVTSICKEWPPDLTLTLYVIISMYLCRVGKLFSRQLSKKRYLHTLSQKHFQCMKRFQNYLERFPKLLGNIGEVKISK
jgi:hypothetical protein